MRRAAVVYIVSDSVGETAEVVVRAAASQFDPERMEIRRVPYVSRVDDVQTAVAAAQAAGGAIAYTLVLPELRSALEREAAERNVRAVDIMGPMLRALGDAFQEEPKLRPGLLHLLDADYFERVEAIEFAVKYDDGRDASGLERADVVLVGVSRTSKTPLSMYLAHKRLRVANIPLLPESEPPRELFLLPARRVIGLTIQSATLNQIRRERLRSLGLGGDAPYASPARIGEELAFAEDVMRRLGCRVIDVSHRAVEEIATLILQHVRDGRAAMP